MHEFLVRIRAQLLWPGHGWMKPKRRRAAGLKSCVLSATATASVPGNVDSMLAGRGDLDNARSQLNRLENLLGMANITATGSLTPTKSG